MLFRSRCYTDRDLPWLLDEWCTNRKIRSTIDFEIRHRGVPVFGFHDDINEAWAGESEREAVESLIRDKLIRVQPAGDRTANRRTGSVLRRALSWIRKRVGGGADATS